MAARYKCAGGHCWEDVMNDPTLIDGQVRCPLCGEISRPLGSVSLQQEPTSEMLPVPAGRPGEQGTIEFPGPSPGSGHSAPSPTIVHPHLAAIPSTNHLGELTQAGAARPAAVAPSRLLTGQAEWPTIPGYEILAELGRGGMGVVYKARQIALNRVVAIKMILGGSQAGDRDRARFNTEAQAVARLVHPNIVQIYEVGEYQGNAYFTLEYVDGGSLADQLDGKPMQVNEAARLMETLARAMHFAHSQGVIHRDLKPANILLHRGESRTAHSAETTRRDQGGSGSTVRSGTATSLPVPKIADFGLAKTMDGDVQNTRSGMVVGTPGYMAPEQASGQGNITPATDTYALGVLLYQVMTARLPFDGDSPMEVMLKVTTQEPPPPSSIVPRLPRDLVTICLKCLEKQPARRYASALDLAEDLRRFQAHEPIQARPITRRERLARWVKRRPALALTLALLFMGTVVALATAGWYAREEQQRIAKERREIQQTLFRASEAAKRGDWEEARVLTSGIRQRVNEQVHLGDYETETQELHDQASGQLETRRRFKAFEKARTAALFQATLSLGTPTPAGLARTRQGVEQALALVGGSAKKLPEPGPYQTTEETKAIRQGCYELMLVLAEVAAQPLPGMTAVQKHEAAAEAVAILDVAAGLGIKTHAHHLRRARHLDQQAKARQADRERQLAKKRPPASSLDHYLIGKDLYLSGDARGAAACFVKSLRLQPDQFWAKYFLALCHVRLGQPQAARDNLTSCLSQQPDVVWIYLVRGFVNGVLGDYPDAEADYRRAQALLTPKQRAKAENANQALYVLYNNRAVTHLGQKKYALAEDDLRKAIALEPGQYQAHVTLAEVHQRRGNKADAREALSKAIEAAQALAGKKELDTGTLALLYRHRYRFLIQSKDQKAALADLDRIIALKIGGTTEALAQRDRGHLLYRDGKYTPALAAYDDALAAGADVSVRRWRAEVLLRLKRYKEAIAGFDAYLAKGGTANVSVYRGRGLAKVQLGDHQSALGDLTLALGLAPKDAGLRVQRGQVYLACAAFKLAATDFETALKLDPKKTAARHGLALAKLQQGHLREAATLAERTAKDAPNDVRVQFNAACVVAQVAGQMQPATKSPSKFTGATASERTRTLNQALALLKRAIELTPKEQRAAYWREVIQPEAALKPLTTRTGYDELKRLAGADR